MTPELSMHKVRAVVIGNQHALGGDGTVVRTITIELDDGQISIELYATPEAESIPVEVR